MTTTLSSQSNYVKDVVYPDYFHREAMPLWLNSTLTANGFQTPDIHSSYKYLDLGCGCGLNLLIAAATNPSGYFIGIDINPEAIAIAKKRASILNLPNLRYECLSFEEALVSSNFQYSFDFIASHGVYSWISHEARATFIRLTEKLLKTGGVFYLAYMCQPGSSNFSAAQKLLQQLSLQLPGSSPKKAKTAFTWLNNLSNQGLGYFIENPKVIDEIQRLKAQDSNYLAHEFLNPNWDSLHVADVFESLENIQCFYAASSNVIDNLDAISLPAQAQPHLQQLQQQGASPALIETFKDLARNQNQRRDIFIKASASTARLDANAQRAKLLQQRVKLIPNTNKNLSSYQGDIFSFNTRIGTVELPLKIIAPLLAALEDGAKYYSELAALKSYQANPGFINQLLQILAGIGLIGFTYATPNQDSEQVEKALNDLLTTCPVGVNADLLESSMQFGSAYRR